MPGSCQDHAGLDPTARRPLRFGVRPREHQRHAPTGTGWRKMEGSARSPLPAFEARLAGDRGRAHRARPQVESGEGAREDVPAGGGPVVQLAPVRRLPHAHRGGDAGGGCAVHRDRDDQRPEGRGASVQRHATEPAGAWHTGRGHPYRRPHYATRVATRGRGEDNAKGQALTILGLPHPPSRGASSRTVASPRAPVTV